MISELSEKLKKTGLKITPQRMQVMKYVVANPGQHFTAEDIHEELRKSEPTIPISTIYNITRALSEAGLMKGFEINGRMVFESNLDTHANFFCTTCGEISDISISPAIRDSITPPGY
ncbi:MAG: Fur family transcriptional regulator, partial [Thermoplasmataceae archaeon]